VPTRIDSSILASGQARDRDHDPGDDEDDDQDLGPQDDARHLHR
jgi:hypothetical protein